LDGCLDEETVLACVEGRLAGPAHTALLSHSDSCPRCHALLVEAARSLVPVDQKWAGRYRLSEPLGQGAMGEVFAAEDDQLRRRVAIKLLRGGLPEDSAGAARLQVEAQALARVAHPNVVHVYETGVVDDRLFIAMELVQGGTLGKWLAQKQRPAREIVNAFIAVGRGLEAVHAAGLVHRDLKPDNVLMGSDGRPRISDFGLARVVAQEEAQPFLDAPLGAPSLTRTGALLGTPAFMSPEQLRGEPASSASDQFSFCVALYHALLGEWPFAGSTVRERLAAIETSRPKPRHLPRALRLAILRGLENHPAARHPSMGALLSALERTQRPRWRLVAVAAAAVAAIPLAFLALRPPACRPDLSGVWDANRRAAVDAAFRRTGLSYAAEALRPVEDALDRYTSQWARHYRDACLLQPEVRALELRCLDRRRQEVDALVRLYTAADAGVIKSASEAAWSLSSLDECADPAALARRPKPRDVKAHARVENRLTELRTLGDGGRYAPGLAEAPALVAEAQKLGDRALEADGELLLGDLRIRTAEFDKAEAHLNSAALAAEAAGDDRLRATALTRLVSLVGARLRRLAEGQELARRADALVERLAGEPRVKAELLYGEGLLAGSQGDYAAEEKRFRDGLAVLKQAEPAPVLEANLDHSLALALFDLDRLPEALDAVLAGMRLRLAIYGREHPVVASSHYLAAAILSALDRPREARPEAEKALAIHQAFVGAQHPDVASTLEVLGNIDEALGDFTSAEDDYRRALAGMEKAFGPDSPNLCNALDGLSSVLQQRRRFDEAERAAQRALQIREKKLGPNHPELMSPLARLCNLFLAKGDALTALRYAERELEIARTESGGEGTPAALTNVGYASFRAGQPQRAEPLLSRAVELLTPRGDGSVDLAEARFDLAQVLWPRDHARALTLAQQAQRAYASGKRPEAAEVQKWLASRNDR
jgi:serine/threonine protein kinase/Tfp pilus assembly protein PilF